MPTYHTNSSGQWVVSEASTTCDSVWLNWNDSSCTITSTSVTWNAWVDDTSNVRAPEYSYYTTGGVRVITPQEAEAAQEKRAQAERKADALLESLLDEEQVSHYRQHRCVVVKAASGRLYEVGARCLVKLLDFDGTVRRQWCWHSPQNYPRGDQIIATMLALLSNEELLWKQGNEHPLRAA